MGMSRAVKMAMTSYRSRNEGNRNEMNRGESNRSEMYRNEGNRGEMYRNEMYGEGYGEGYRNEAEGTDMEMRRRRDRRGRFMEAENNDMRYEGYRNESGNTREYQNADMRSAGNESRMKIIYPGTDRAENRMEGNEEHPKPYLLPRAIGFHGAEEKHQKGSSEHQHKELDQRTAQEWTQKMESEDGSKGPRWTIEQVKPLMMQVRFTGNPLEFWAIMNALYSDYCMVAEKYGVSRPEFFAELAKAWLEDKDAVPNKAAMYYDCIVKH